MSETDIVLHWYSLSSEIFDFWKYFVFISFPHFIFFEISFFFLRFHFFQVLFYLILFISWPDLTLTLTRFWHYLTVTLIRSGHCLTLTLIEFWNFWALKNFFLIFFFFFEISFVLRFFLIWKKIKITDKNLNKKISWSLSKQWLIHQQLLSYCQATSKTYKKFDFKAKSSDPGKGLFNSVSGTFTQYSMILSIVFFFFFIIKTASLLK